ncbi:MAG: dihydrodipicolinate reductase C-terminal domain-containing protein [Chloroflexota bacterium]
MRALLTGAGNMGRAIGAALEARGDTVAAIVGRSGRPDPASLGPVDVAFEFSHAASFVDNLRYLAAAGARNVVVGTTGWTGNPATVAAADAVIAEHGLRVVVGPTFSIGVVLFTEVAEEAAKRFGRFPEFDAYVFEQHRRTKADRPSGTASAIADRMLPHLPSKRRAHLPEGEAAPDPDTLEVVALRIGAHPGMHVVGFEAPGESIELRVTARDRSAYVAGAVLAADRLLADPTWPAGRSSFVDLVRGITAGTSTD